MRVRHVLSTLVVGCIVALCFGVWLRAYTVTATWPAHTASFYLNPTNGDNALQAGRTDADVVAALQTAMAVWNHAGGTDFTFTYAGRATDTETALDNRNVILFSPGGDGSAVAGTYGWWNAANQFSDVDIVLWDGPFAFYTDDTLCGSTAANPTMQTVPNAAKLVDIFVHELGHATGLNHTTVIGATMYPSYPYCSTEYRSLESDDLAGMQFLYGLLPPPQLPPPSGPALTVTGRKVKGVPVVDLRWSGLTATSVTIARDGVLRVTANDGVETDTVTKKGAGTYTYQVCDAVCTNTATVTF